MTDAAIRVSVSKLSKVFDLQKRRRGRTGVSSTEVMALAMLGRSVLGRGVKEARRFYALRDINLKVRAGEIMGIIGRNGAGKSTMLKVLARVIDPSYGSIRLDGKVASLLELGAGFTGDLTVAENIALHVALSGGKHDPDLEQRILELAELTEYRDTDLDDCPGGAAARLSFATLISISSDIVLADEMLAVGDTRFKELVLTRIESVRAEGGCVLFVSHDLRAIAQICDRVMWIDRGQVRMVGDVRRVIRAYEAELKAKTSALDAGSGDAGKIIDLRLADADGHQVGSLRLDRAAYIECILQHLHPKVPLTLTFDVMQGRRQLVFSASQTIETGAGVPRALRARLKIPAHFLNQAHYELSARLHWTPENDARKEVVMKVGFATADSAAEKSVWGTWGGRRVGVIAPKLNWRISVERDQPIQTEQT